MYLNLSRLSIRVSCPSFDVCGETLDLVVVAFEVGEVFGKTVLFD